MKFKKILVSEDNQLIVGDFGLTEDQVEIIDLNKSLSDVVNDQDLKNFIISNIVNDEKIYMVCLKENFGSTDQVLEDIPNVKKLNKEINKTFKKYSNLFFFVYNTYLKKDEVVNPSLDQESAFVPSEPFIDQELKEQEKNFIENMKNETIESDKQDESPFEEINEQAPIELKDENNLEQNSGQVLDEQINNSDENLVQNETNNNIDNVVLENNELSSNNDELKNSDLNFDDSNKEINQSSKIISEEASEMISNDQSYENVNLDLEAEKISSNDLFKNEQNLNINNENKSKLNLDSVDLVASERFKEQPIIFNNKLDDSVDMPESFFDVSQDDVQISKEDYDDFVNDYELNVHALKSIYDFIWRVLVTNNYNLKLNDLLYISVNNLDAFSIGQSDFVRQTVNKAESLFDLILQLDIKLEFNNSLFYIYLAEFFLIQANKIVVNKKFIETLSIWVDKSSQKRFVDQIEKFMNYSSIYNKKIVFSYFIEISNFIKGCLPSISPSITLIDIHKILNNPFKRNRKENIFNLMINKINEIFKDNNISVEMYLIDSPENVYGFDEITKLSRSNDDWKTQLITLYKKLVQNILNYILLKGNSETEIFNIYIDIKELRLYKNVLVSKNILSPEIISALNNQNLSDATYSYTIGDIIHRDDYIVSSQNNNYSIDSNKYLNTIKGNPNLFVNDDSKQFNTDVLSSNLPSQNLHPEYKPSSNIDEVRSRYTSRFNMTEFETSMSKKIEEYEKKIKSNIARIEAERKQLKQKMQDLKNL